MNNFNNVFRAVRDYCNQVNHTDEDCFKTIAATANVPYEKLDVYLSSLHDLKFINYSYPDNSIELTEAGKKSEKLFI